MPLAEQRVGKGDEVSSAATGSSYSSHWLALAALALLTIRELDPPLHLGISVSNLETSVEWYSEYLGFTLTKQVDLSDNLRIAILEYQGFGVKEAGSGTSYERFPIHDVSVPAEPKSMPEIVAAIDRAIAERGITYVHCRGGVGRTGLAVACWLQERGQTPDEALASLADKWRSWAKSQRLPNSPETREQVRWVKEWPLHRSRLHLQNDP